ncbi:hypothetical protein BaRGS_00010329, partial [Batillaria attramentaria]
MLPLVAATLGHFTTPVTKTPQLRSGIQLHSLTFHITLHYLVVSKLLRLRVNELSSQPVQELLCGKSLDEMTETSSFFANLNLPTKPYLLLLTSPQLRVTHPYPSVPSAVKARRGGKRGWLIMDTTKDEKEAAPDSWACVAATGNCEPELDNKTSRPVTQPGGQPARPRGGVGGSAGGTILPPLFRYPSLLARPLPITLKQAVLLEKTRSHLTCTIREVELSTTPAPVVVKYLFAVDTIEMHFDSRDNKAHTTCNSALEISLY